MPVPGYTNPLSSSYFADPFVWRAEGDYWAIGTGQAEAGGAVSTQDGPSVFPLLRSPDLVHWRDAGRALVRPPAELGDTFWAPEVASQDGTWFLYYSVGYGDQRHQLRVATSQRPQGPYLDLAGLTEIADCPFAIDPHPFRDEDGRWYLFHARDFLSTRDEQDREVRAGTALVVHPLLDMTHLSTEGRTVARARRDWQRFAADRPMYGRRFDWHTLEGPFVVSRDGRYYCLYSGGCWHTDSYGVDYVSATSVMGPWQDEAPPDGPRILRTVPGKVIGPGHCSVVRDVQGGTDWVAYHAWDAGMTARRLCLDPLFFTRDGPRSPGPTWTPQPDAAPVFRFAPG